MNASKIVKLLSVCAAVCCLSGCVVLSTDSANKPSDGSIIYHLPRGLSRVQLFGKPQLDRNGNPLLDANNKIVFNPNAYQLVCTGEVVMQADPRHRYQLNYQGNWLSDDAITVNLGANGLLDKITVTTEDKSPQLVVKLAELAKEIAKGVAMFRAEGGETELFNSMFDPSDPDDVQRINAELERITGTRDYSISTPPPAIMYAMPSNAGDGVLYRAVAPYLFQIKNRAVATPITVLIPNRSELQVLPIKRAAFVKKVQTLDFENGILTEFSLTLPSQVLGFIEIPIEIARTIVSVPAEMLTIKVNQATNGKNLLEAQKALLEAQRALLEAQKEK